MFNALKHNAFTNRLLRRTPLVYPRAMRHITGFETLDLAQRQALHAGQIAAVLEKARTLPGYSFAQASVDLSDWPVLKKHQLLGREHMFASNIRYPAPKAATGGTTGQPLKFRRSYYNIVFEQAIIDHICSLAGAHPHSSRIAVLRGDFFALPAANPPVYWIDQGKRHRIYSAHHLTSETAGRYVQSLRQFGADILFCYPSSLGALLTYTERLDGLRIPLVVTSSEVLHAQTLMAAREQLGCHVIDYYGHAERVVSAYSINGGGYRFLGSYGHVELLPCGDGRARIVATSLRPNGQILVRYETGDIARTGHVTADELDQMAMGLMPFNGIEGRESEFITLADGRRIIGLNHIPRDVAGAASLQLHQTGVDEVDIYIVPARGFDHTTAQTIVKNFYAKFPAAVQARLWTVDAPLREPNGKAPLLLRNPAIPNNRAPREHPFSTNRAA